MRRRLSPPLVATAILLIVPAAGAAPSPTAPDARAELDEPPRIDPVEGVETTTLTVTYNCAKAHPTQATKVRVDVVDAPDWLTATPVQTTVHPAPDPATCARRDLRRSVDVEILLSAAPDAPARRPADLTVEATVTLADGPHRARATTQVEAAYYGAIRVDLPSRARAAASEEASYPITVHNQGNGPTRIALAAADVDDGLSLKLPDGGHAPAFWQADNTTWRGEIVAVGAEPDAIYEATINVTPAYAEDPATAGPALHRTLALRTTGGAAPTRSGGLAATVLPGFGAGFAAVLGVGLAWLGRRD